MGIIVVCLCNGETVSGANDVESFSNNAVFIPTCLFNVLLRVFQLAAPTTTLLSIVVVVVVIN